VHHWFVIISVTIVTIHLLFVIYYINWLTIATALMSACDLINNSTTDEWPILAAKCNGVYLSCLK